MMKTLGLVSLGWKILFVFLSVGFTAGCAEDKNTDQTTFE